MQRPDQEADNAVPADGGLESRRARKAAILVEVQSLLTRDIYGNMKSRSNSAGRDGRLKNLNVVIEFKKMLEEDKVMVERVLARSAIEGAEEGKKKGKLS